MSDLPKVSVVIPCLNRAHYLEPTIESILQQDYPNMECIVMDGGSTDETLQILSRYDKKLKWVSQADGGQAEAINKGWQMSEGTILTWLNADDLWAVPDSVSRAVQFLQDRPEVDVVYGNCGVIDSEGNLLGTNYIHEWDLQYAVEFCDHCIAQPASFIRRSILEKVGWLDAKFRQLMDHELWLRIGLQGKIEYAPILLAFGRILPYDTSHQWQTGLACVRLTKKFFRLSGVPEQIRNGRKRAISNAHIRAMVYAWEGGRHWPPIFRNVVQAIFNDPFNFDRAYKRFRYYVSCEAAEGDLLFKTLLLGIEFPLYPRRFARHVKRWITNSRPEIPNLLGDRDLKLTWMISNMPAGPGKALEFSSGGSHLALVAAERGFQVTSIDPGDVQYPYRHPDLRFLRGDLLAMPLSDSHFDLVLNCSLIEPLSPVNRGIRLIHYPDRDIAQMKKLRELLKPGRTMLIVLPVGEDAISAELRIYGREALRLILQGYEIVKESYWMKNHENLWVSAEKEQAIRSKTRICPEDPLQSMYALGCFVLKRPIVSAE